MGTRIGRDTSPSRVGRDQSSSVLRSDPSGKTGNSLYRGGSVGRSNNASGLLGDRWSNRNRLDPHQNARPGDHRSTMRATFGRDYDKNNGFIRLAPSLGSASSRRGHRNDGLHGLRSFGGRDGYYRGRGGRSRSYYGHLLGRSHYYRPYPNYYSAYRPFYYGRRCDHDWWFGFGYVSLYYPFPYDYSPVNVDVYYPPDTSTTTIIYGNQPSEPMSAVDAPATMKTIEIPPPEDDGAVSDSLVIQGNQAFAGGRFEEASRFYIQATMADERDGYAKLLYAVASFAMGDFDVAGSAIHRALLTSTDLMEYPFDVRALYDDPLVYYGQMSELQTYLTKHPGNRDAQILAGYLYFATGEPDRALDTLRPLGDQDVGDDLAGALQETIQRVKKNLNPPE